MKSLFKIALAIAVAATWFQARANDAFNNYVADVHLYESYQLRSPEPAIRYADGDKGALLKSVLNPAQVKEMLAIYWQRSKQNADSSNFPQLMTPILNRYQKAFEANGYAYENEYLDSVEIASIMTISSLAMMNGAQPINPSNKDGSKPSADQEKLASSLNSLFKNVAGLMATVKQQFAADLRKKIDAGKFSAEGAKRAFKLVDSLTAPTQ